MDGANVVVPDIFAASPFSEPYPLSRQEIAVVQPSVPWTDNLDYVLSGLVRKYRFDFHRVSRSFRKYVEVILCEFDEENFDPNHYSEEACRLRWSLLDFEEFQRRKIVAQELITMRTLPGPWFHKSAPPPDSDIQSFHEEMTVECDISTTTKRTAETEQANPSLDTRSHGTASSFTHDTFVDDKKVSSESPYSSDSVPQTLRSSNDLSCLRKLDVDSDKSSNLTAVSTKHLNSLSTSEESDKVARSFEVQVNLTQAHPDSFVTTTQNNPRQLSELERSVLDEGLEISDFTIFSHSLKTQFEGFYNEVRGALPAMRGSASSSGDEEDDDQEEPIFSNLRVDEKTGDYVGHIVGIAPLNIASNSTPSFAGAASKASLPASIQSIVSEPAAVFECKKITLQEPKTQADMSSTEYREPVLSHPVRLEEDSAPALESTEDPALTAGWCQERADGQLCAGRGDHAGAVAHLSRAISSAEATGAAGAGTLAEMWQERAESLMAIQHYAEAADDWRRLILAMERERGGGVTANVATARLQLAISLRFTGNYVDAAHEVEKVLQVEPENQVAR